MTRVGLVLAQVKGGNSMGQVNVLAFGHGDIAVLKQWVNNQGERFFYQWGGAAVFRFPLDDAQIQAHVESSVGENPPRRLYKEVDDSGQMVGYIELHRIDYLNKSALVSRVSSVGLTSVETGLVSTWSDHC
jgi:hypothetical protein